MVAVGAAVVRAVAPPTPDPAHRNQGFATRKGPLRVATWPFAASGVVTQVGSPGQRFDPRRTSCGASRPTETRLRGSSTVTERQG